MKNQNKFQQVECCGVNGPEDWNDIFIPPTPSSNDSEDGFMNLTVPSSCCETIDFDGNTCQAYEHGCLNRMSFLISQSAVIVATGVTTVAFVQVYLKFTF